MNTSTIDPDVQSYLHAVAAHLVDLPETERDELIEDLREHLEEVAAESDGPLADRLGPPDAYAEEFRASAGLPSGAGDAPAFLQRAATRLTHSGPGRLVRQALASRPARALVDALPDFRPGWWVLRGYLAVLLLDVLVGYQFYGDVDDLLVPHIGGSQVWTIVAIGGAIWASVSLGRRSSAGRGRSLSILVNLAVVVLGVIGYSQLNQPVYAMTDYYGSGTEVPEYLHHRDGSAITNICPYGADGKPLAGVLLFDQSGRAIENTADPRSAGIIAEIPSVPTIRNAYPQQQQIFDPSGGPTVPFRCPEVLVPGAPPVTQPGVPTPIPT